MSKRFLFCLILFLSFPFSGCSARYYSREQADLTLKTVKKEEATDDLSTWDFGRVIEGQVLKHIFTLKNEFPKTLNIKNVTTSCGCTISQVKKKTLLPGESTLIEVEFHSKGYSGAINQFVYVTTDSLDKEILRFTIKAEVVKR